MHFQSREVSCIKTIAILVLFATSPYILAACSNEAEPPKEKYEAESVVPEVIEENNKLEDDKRIYDRDVDRSIKSLYITVLPKDGSNDNSVSWYDLNNITNRYSEEYVKIIISEGTEDGVGPKPEMFGYGEEIANAKMSLRGNTARYAPQKSYKIKLFEDTDLWQNQQTINLNKHSYDTSRLGNKLSFDLLEKIPNITSLRTQFIHLYVKDLTGETQQTSYEDYGLYTHVEQPNKLFLKSHWLDPDGYLYKVNFFEFQRYQNHIKSVSDPTYDKEQFEMYLEIKGREDHDKLISMIEDVNNMQIPIGEVIEKHFDLDNFLTWTAINIIMDNMDTNANNFYLYSPLNSEKWYMLPWDYDGAWQLERVEDTIRPYQAGISNYWGSMLHNRYFRTEEHIQLLTDKVKEMSMYVNAQTVENQLNDYAGIVKEFLIRAPDKEYLKGSNIHFETDLQRIIATPEQSVQRYLEDLEKPKPFYMNDVENDGKHLTFSWQISYDLQGNDLYYDITVAKDPLLTQVIGRQENLLGNEFQMLKPEDGNYYWKVFVRDSEGNEQTSFDMYMDEGENFYYGIRQFEVN